MIMTGHTITDGKFKKKNFFPKLFYSWYGSSYYFWTKRQKKDVQKSRKLRENTENIFFCTTRKLSI